MNELDRTELFTALAELARRYPHWRVGQLVGNVAGWADAEVWDAENGQLLAAARAHLQSTHGSERAIGGPNPPLRQPGAA
jgi:hypothetical protein